MASAAPKPKPNKWKAMAQEMYAKKAAQPKNQNKNGYIVATNNNNQSTQAGNAAQGGAIISGGRRNYVAPAVAPKLLCDFVWADVLYLSKTAGKVKLIPLRNQHNQPLCLKLTGGGSIPKMIGLSVTNHGKTRMTFSCDDRTERAALTRMHDDATTSCLPFIKEWFPEFEGPVDVTVLVAKMISDVRAKKDRGGEWPQLVNVNINENDLYSTDSRNEPDLIITNEDGKSVMNLPDILGQKWTSMTIELQWLCLGMNEEADPPHPVISCSKRIRRLRIEADLDQFHYVFPENQASHEASECKLQHCQIVPLKIATLKDHAFIADLQAKDQSKTAFISHQAGGDFIIKLTGGGVLPPFVFEANRDGKFQITVSIDSPEDEKSLDTLTQELRLYTVANRHVYYPKSEDEDKALMKFVKRLLARKSDKPEHADYSRSLQCIVDVEKFGSGLVRIVDEVGQYVQFRGPEDIQVLVGKRWQELWISLRCVYVKTISAGENWEVGFSKRFVYMKLQPEFRLEDSVSNDDTIAPPPPVTATTSDNNSRNAPKKQRVN